MNRKLIIVEGLPGSGKSTTAKLIGEILEPNVNHEVILEGSLNHPADYDGVSFFNETQFKELIEEYNEYSELIEKISYKNTGGYFTEYKKAIYIDKIDFIDGLKQRFYKNDIYELPFELHRKLIKLKWQEFSRKALNKNKLYIFECPFIQNPVTVSMIRNNTAKQDTISYIKQLENIIKQLNPLIVYVKQRDIEHSFKRVAKSRSEGWLNFFVHYYTKQGYGAFHNLAGLLGTIEVLKAREQLEIEIIQKLDIDCVTIDNSDFNIDNYKKKLQNLI